MTKQNTVIVASKRSLPTIRCHKSMYYWTIETTVTILVFQKYLLQLFTIGIKKGAKTIQCLRFLKRTQNRFPIRKQFVAKLIQKKGHSVEPFYICFVYTKRKDKQNLDGEILKPVRPLTSVSTGYLAL